MKGGQSKRFSLLPLISEHTRQGMYLQLIILLASLSTNALTNTAKLCAEVLILPDYKGVLIPPFSGVLNPLLERAYSPPVYTPRYYTPYSHTVKF